MDCSEFHAIDSSWISRIMSLIFALVRDSNVHQRSFGTSSDDYILSEKTRANFILSIVLELTRWWFLFWPLFETPKYSRLKIFGFLFSTFKGYTWNGRIGPRGRQIVDFVYETVMTLEGGSAKYSRNFEIWRKIVHSEAFFYMEVWGTQNNVQLYRKQQQPG